MKGVLMTNYSNILIFIAYRNRQPNSQANETRHSYHLMRNKHSFILNLQM